MIDFSSISFEQAEGMLPLSLRVSILVRLVPSGYRCQLEETIKGRGKVRYPYPPSAPTPGLAVLVAAISRELPWPPKPAPALDPSTLTLESLGL